MHTQCGLFQTPQGAVRASVRLAQHRWLTKRDTPCWPAVARVRVRIRAKRYHRLTVPTRWPFSLGTIKPFDPITTCSTFYIVRSGISHQTLSKSPLRNACGNVSPAPSIAAQCTAKWSCVLRFAITSLLPYN